MVHRPRAALTAALAGSLVLTAAGATSAPATPATASQDVTFSLGTAWGGATAQDFPVVLTVDGPQVRRLTRAIAVLRMPCSSGGYYDMRDGYRNLKVDKKGRFKSSFGPETDRSDDGTSADFEGSIKGKVNRLKTRASGTWQLKMTVHDAAGAVTDVCDSGLVKWKVAD